MKLQQFETDVARKEMGLNMFDNSQLSASERAARNSGLGPNYNNFVKRSGDTTPGHNRKYTKDEQVTTNTLDLTSIPDLDSHQSHGTMHKMTNV